MKYTKIITIFFILLSLLISVNASDSYSRGDNNYGGFVNVNGQLSNPFEKGYTIPSQIGNFYVVENKILYYANRSGNAELFTAYDLENNITLWTTNLAGLFTNPKNNIKINDTSIIIQTGGSNIQYYILDKLTGLQILNYTSTITPQGYYTDEFNFTGSLYKRLIVGNPSFGIYYNNSLNQLSDNINSITYGGFSFYDTTTKFAYTMSGNNDDINYGKFNGTTFIGVTTKVFNYGTKRYNPYTELSYPIYDKVHRYIIQDIYTPNNLTLVQKIPNIVPIQYGKGCWVKSSCGYDTQTFNMYCSKGDGNTSTYTCFDNSDCSSPTPYCNLIDSLGEKRCTNDNSAGICLSSLKDECLILVPDGQIYYSTYDSLTQDLYQYVYNGTNLNIYYADLYSCDFNTQTNITATLLGSYGQLVSALSSYPVMDRQYIYTGLYNVTGSYFMKIERSNGILLYNRLLTKNMYNSSMSGNAGMIGYNYDYHQIGYDNYLNDVYTVVDDYYLLKFSGYNYTTCPFEDVHYADPLCYTNNTLNLIDHRYCDTSQDPTDIQRCVNKNNLHTSCIRDWQCSFGNNFQGYCDLDFSDECSYTDSSLGYNCSCGLLSWEEASNPPNGFWFYQITSGDTNSLFDAYSVSNNLEAVIYDITNRSINITLNSSLFYRVEAIDQYSQIYYKSDIIAGTAGTTSTTTTTTTTTIPSYSGCLFNLSVNVISLNGTGIQNSLVKGLYCPTNNMNFGSSPYNPLTANMLQYYYSGGNCYNIREGYTNSNGEYKTCIGATATYNNYTNNDECCYGLVCYPCPYNSYTLINYSTIPYEMIFTGSKLPEYVQQEYYADTGSDILTGNLNYTIILKNKSESNNMRLLHIYVYNAMNNISLNGVNVLVHSSKDTKTGITNITGQIDYDMQYVLDYSVTLTKTGYFTRTYTEYFDLSLFDSYLNLGLMPINTTTRNLSGYILDNNSGLGIPLCPIKAGCQYKLDENDLNRIDVTYNTISDNNGYYKFNLNYLADCIITTMCQNHKNDYFYYTVFNDTTHNFSLTRERMKFKLYGYVFDKTSLIGGIVPNAHILISNDDVIYSENTISDNKGFYSVNNFIEGNVTITTSKEGYGDTIDKINLIGNTKHDIYLIPSSKYYWLRGTCLEEDTNYTKTPIPCKISIYDNGALKNELQADNNGRFQIFIGEGIYYITGTYRGVDTSKAVQLQHDLQYEDFTLIFTTTSSNLLQDIRDLQDWIHILWPLVLLIVIMLIFKVMDELM